MLKIKKPYIIIMSVIVSTTMLAQLPQDALQNAVIIKNETLNQLQRETKKDQIRERISKLKQDQKKIEELKEKIRDEEIELKKIELEESLFLKDVKFTELTALIEVFNIPLATDAEHKELQEAIEKILSFANGGNVQKTFRTCGNGWCRDEVLSDETMYFNIILKRFPYLAGDKIVSLSKELSEISKNIKKLEKETKPRTLYDVYLEKNYSDAK